MEKVEINSKEWFDLSLKSQQNRLIEFYNLNKNIFGIDFNDFFTILDTNITPTENKNEVECKIKYSIYIEPLDSLVVQTFLVVLDILDEDYNDKKIVNSVLRQVFKY